MRFGTKSFCANVIFNTGIVAGLFTAICQCYKGVSNVETLPFQRGPKIAYTTIIILIGILLAVRILRAAQKKRPLSDFSFSDIMSWLALVSSQSGYVGWRLHESNALLQPLQNSLNLLSFICTLIALWVAFKKAPVQLVHVNDRVVKIALLGNFAIVFSLTLATALIQ